MTLLRETLCIHEQLQINRSNDLHNNIKQLLAFLHLNKYKKQDNNNAVKELYQLNRLMIRIKQRQANHVSIYNRMFMDIVIFSPMTFHLKEQPEKPFFFVYQKGQADCN